MVSIAIVDLKTGEMSEQRLEIAQGGNNRFPQKGQKMYDTGLVKLLETMTNKEITRLVKMHEDSKIIGKHNLFQIPFKDATSDMGLAVRSRFKSKLIENDVIFEFGKNQIMLNPFMFLPREDKNIKNSQYLTQQLWKYYIGYGDHTDALDVFQDEILPGTRKESNTIRIKDRFYDKPERIES